MTRTHRRKIARSVAIRRVKPNTKRKERKTQKRKSRNIVMKGGVHKNLKVYVILQNPGTPKCIIVRETSTLTGKDTIYLFFDSHMNSDEIKEFVYAAMGLKTGAVDLRLPSNENGNLIVKLCVNISWKYYLSIGYVKNSDLIPGMTFTKCSNSLKQENGAAIIKSLEDKTGTMTDYTFTEIDTEHPYFNNRVYNTFDHENFTLKDVSQLFQSIRKNKIPEVDKFCSAPETPISKKMNLLRDLLAKQDKVHKICRILATRLLGGKSDNELWSDETQQQIADDKVKALKVIKDHELYYDLEAAQALIVAVKADPKYGICKPALDRLKRRTSIDGYHETFYLDDHLKIDSVEKKIEDAYPKFRS